MQVEHQETHLLQLYLLTLISNAKSYTVPCNSMHANSSGYLGLPCCCNEQHGDFFFFSEKEVVYLSVVWMRALMMSAKEEERQ